MTLHEYEEIVANTSFDDWSWVHCERAPIMYQTFSVWTDSNDTLVKLDINAHHDVATLKADLAISFAYGITDNDNYTAEWANQFADSSASSYYMDFFYNGTLVFRDVFVSVDGGRCSFPSPYFRQDENGNSILIVERKRMAFCRMFGARDSYFTMHQPRYLEHVTITDESWMTDDAAVTA